MAANSRPSTELLIPKEWRGRETTSNERTKIGTEHKLRWTEKKVSVVYYISRDGHLEQPHFMEVPLSCSEGLYLRDVMNELNFLRGDGMASMYSWSSKRSYRNGFVWHDLSENDLIHPTHGREYVLKGSEIIRSSLSFRYCEKIGSSETLPGTKASVDGCEFPATISRGNQSLSSFDNSHQFRVYQAESSMELARISADASTQTGDERRRRRSGREENRQGGETTTELSRVEAASTKTTTPSSNHHSEISKGGRMKASRVLKHLLTCGSVSVKVCKSTKSKVGG